MDLSWIFYLALAVCFIFAFGIGANDVANRYGSNHLPQPRLSQPLPQSITSRAAQDYLPSPSVFWSAWTCVVVQLRDLHWQWCSDDEKGNINSGRVRTWWCRHSRIRGTTLSVEALCEPERLYWNATVQADTCSVPTLSTILPCAQRETSLGDDWWHTGLCCWAYTAARRPYTSLH